MLEQEEMIIEVVSPENETALMEFASFRGQVYRNEDPNVPSLISETIVFFRHKGPFSEGRQFHILLARGPKKTVARAVAVLDQRYNQHWGEQLGHIIMFEALPDSREKTMLLLRAACEWLRKQGAIAVRVGFGPFEPGFVIDDYGTFAPRMTRHNLSYYHSLLKDADFETEKGAGEYVITISEELRALYQGYLRTARQSGYDILPLRKIRATQRVADFTATWNDAYASHWGLAPLTQDEFAMLFDSPDDTNVLDLSAIAYHKAQPAGIVLVRDDNCGGRRPKWWRTRHPLSEFTRLSSFSVGVSQSQRGHGISLALAASAYLQLIDRGEKYLSYGLVLDDNWRSRLTAKKLGAHACANYLTYRRALQ